MADRCQSNMRAAAVIHDVPQGEDEWLNLRCGMLTASQVKEIVTPTLKLASNDKSRALANKIAVQRVTGIVEEAITTEKMLRGHIDEDIARRIYDEKYEPVTEAGLITNPAIPNFGYSPDGLVGDNAVIEVKSRDPHLHVASLLEFERSGDIPKEYMAQIQSGLLVSGRTRCDFISFSHGLPMMVAPVWPDQGYQDAILRAIFEFEATVSCIVNEFAEAVTDVHTYTPTERIDYEGMMI